MFGVTKMTKKNKGSFTPLDYCCDDHRHTQKKGQKMKLPLHGCWCHEAKQKKGRNFTPPNGHKMNQSKKTRVLVMMIHNRKKN
jgi:hypothetical protein